MVNGLQKYFILRLTWLRIIAIALWYFRNPKTAFKVLVVLEKIRKQYNGNTEATKAFKANGKYFFYNHVPGFPSRAFDSFHKEELNSIRPFKAEAKRLRSVIFSITKRCPLNCEHCYEIDLLNKKEKLRLDDLKKIVSELQQEGVTQIYLSGGEPMARFSDLLELLKSARKGTDFWLITSGYHLTLEKAILLKKTRRLTGVSISLDHFLPEAHDAFRQKSNSYQDAVNAIKNCRQADLVAGMAICTTRSFVQWENLMRYAELGHELGAHFIQLQEPYAVGAYLGKDVTLKNEHLIILDLFYKEVNTNPRYSHLPIIVFHGYHQRKIGCFGGGHKYLYIDSDGNVHSCPYCKAKKANILEDTLNQCIEKLESKGCGSFVNVPKISNAVYQ